MPNRSLIIVFTFVLFGTTARGADVPGTSDSSHLHWNVTDSILVTVTVPKLPPSRFVLSFSSDEGVHKDLVWDPLVDTRLVRRIRLDRGKWHIAPWSKAIRQENDPIVNAAWFVRGGSIPVESVAPPIADDSKAAPSSLVVLERYKDVSAGYQDMPVTLLIACRQAAGPSASAGQQVRPAANPEPGSLGDIREGSTGDTKLVGDLKSLLAAPANDARTAGAGSALSAISIGGRSIAVGELLATIATVALDRAKAKGMRLLERRFHGLCADSGAPALEFPRTCRLLKRIRIEDLATVGLPVVRSLLADLAAMALDAVSGSGEPVPPPVKAVLDAVEPFLLDLIAGVEEGVAPSAREIVARALDSAKDEICKSSESDLCKALTEAALCGVEDACDLSDLGRRLVVAEVKAPRLVDLARRVALALHDRGSLKPWDAVSVAIDIAIALVEDVPWQERLMQLRDIAAAVVRSDFQTAAAAAVELLELADPAEDTIGPVRTFLRFVVPIASLVRAFGTGATPEQSAEARRKAVELLFDQASNRAERAGHTIFSVGVDVMALGGVRVSSKFDCVSTAAPLSISLGFGLDRIGAGAENGFHLGVGVLDLAGYLQLDDDNKIVEPGWGDILRLSLTLGWIFSVDEAPAWLGAQVGWAPTATFEGQEAEGSWNAGLVVGVELPFFDFN